MSEDINEQKFWTTAIDKWKNENNIKALMIADMLDSFKNNEIKEKLEEIYIAIKSTFLRKKDKIALLRQFIKDLDRVEKAINDNFLVHIRENTAGS